MSDIHFRQGEIDDLSTLYDFEQGIVAAERPFDATLNSGHIHYYDLKEMIQSPEIDLVVALVNEEIIGSAYLKIKESEPFKKHSHYGYLGLCMSGQRIGAGG